MTDVGVTFRSRKICLGNRRPHAPEDVCGGNREITGNFCRLVESARPLPRSMKRNRDGDVGAREDGGAVTREQRGQWPRKRLPSIVLERVHDVPKRAIVVADRPAPSQVMRSPSASRTRAAIDTDAAPRRQRIAADVAEWRSEMPDALPAGSADGATRGFVEGCFARSANRGENDRQERVS